MNVVVWLWALLVLAGAGFGTDGAELGSEPAAPAEHVAVLAIVASAALPAPVRNRSRTPHPADGAVASQPLAGTRTSWSGGLRRVDVRRRGPPGVARPPTGS